MTPNEIIEQDNTLPITKQDGGVEYEKKQAEEFVLRMFNATLKNIKRALPSKCTMLAPYKEADGTLLVMVRIRGVKDAEYLSTPDDLNFTEAAVKVLTKEILSLL